jgi:hypothetical protein
MAVMAPAASKIVEYYCSKVGRCRLSSRQSFRRLRGFRRPPIRVTRLGDFLPFGRFLIYWAIFYLGRFFTLGDFLSWAIFYSGRFFTFSNNFHRYIINIWTGLHFGRLWEDVGLHYGRFGEKFGYILGALRRTLGYILGAIGRTSGYFFTKKHLVTLPAIAI